VAESGLDVCMKSAGGREVVEGTFSLGMRKGDVERGTRVGIRFADKPFDGEICGCVGFDGRRLTRGRSELGRLGRVDCGCTCG